MKCLLKRSLFSWILPSLMISPLLCSSATSGHVTYPDFNVSMMREGRSLDNYEDSFIKKPYPQGFTNSNVLDLFRNLYAHNIIISKTAPKEDVYRIPPIIHQIWLGSPVPKKYYDWMCSWTSWLGWEYKLWTDEDVKNMTLYNQELYDIADNYGEKSDILRLEILYEYGGIYVDVDYECIKPYAFDELHKNFDFYIGFEPVEHGTEGEYDMFKVCNALIASAPGHPLMRNFIVNMRDNYFKYKDFWTVERTGPSYLSREVFAYEKHHFHPHERNIYFPSTFFYPISEPEVRFSSCIEEIFSLISPETIAIHYWSGSWHKPKCYADQD